MEMRKEMKKIWREWEKLRIHYNCILLAATGIGILLAIKSIGNGGNGPAAAIFDRDFLLELPFYAFGANVLYCFGPFFEIYLYYLSPVPKTFRKPAFLVGSMLGATLAYLITRQSCLYY